jgi:hypothetical protein
MYDDTRPATEAEAHAEWHMNAGVPMGTSSCPWDACDPDDGYEEYQAEIERDAARIFDSGTIFEMDRAILAIGDAAASSFGGET